MLGPKAKKVAIGFGLQFLSTRDFCSGFQLVIAMNTRKRTQMTPPLSMATQVRVVSSHSQPVPVTPPSTTSQDQKFHDLGVSAKELRPSVVLTTGQCFHWTALSESKDNDSAWGVHNATDWIGILRTRNDSSLVIRLRETPSTVLFHALYSPPDWTTSDIRQHLRDYFQLDVVSVVDLYQSWSKRCDRLRRIAQAIPGLRMVEQDPFECLVSFLCSSNNNIPRITQMLQRIRKEYGTPLLEFQGETLYSFPSLSTLREKATEKDLRGTCRMGYRAKYLIKTMEILHELGDEKYLYSLRENENANEVQTALIKFSGVGRKVADCVALCSLRAVDAVPVDVHVWNIARRDYGMDEVVSSASLTPKTYGEVATRLRQQFPDYSGWAHALLFAAELPSFKGRLPVDMVQEMDQVREKNPSDVLLLCLKQPFLWRAHLFLRTQFREAEKQRKRKASN